MTKPKNLYLPSSESRVVLIIMAICLGGCQTDSTALSGKTWKPDYRGVTAPNVTMDASSNGDDGGLPDSGAQDSAPREIDGSAVDLGADTASSNSPSDGSVTGDSAPADAAHSDAASARDAMSAVTDANTGSRSDGETPKPAEKADQGSD
jgi:hypothetical protein